MLAELPESRVAGLGSGWPSDARERLAPHAHFVLMRCWPIAGHCGFGNTATRSRRRRSRRRACLGRGRTRQGASCSRSWRILR